MQLQYLITPVHAPRHSLPNIPKFPFFVGKFADGTIFSGPQYTVELNLPSTNETIEGPLFGNKMSNEPVEANTCKLS